MKKLKVEIADTPLRIEYGLMDRKSLDANSGMLFKFPYAHYPRFWMRNTYIPLDIAFIDDEGKILQIETMRPLTTNTHNSRYPCKMALEVNEGWFKSNNIGVGSYIVGEGITHRKGKCIVAQGFFGKLKGLWDQWVKRKDPKDKLVSKPDQPEDKKKEAPKDDAEAEMNPPEAGPEGDYPTTFQTEPMPPADTTQQAKPEIEYIRDVRGKIRFAEEHDLQMEIIYWTLRGHMLPPRKVQPIEGEGYPIKSGKNGEYLVAFDMSPSISGGGGWTIKGMQPKSFLLDNIINLTLIDANGQEIPPETVAALKAQEKGQQPLPPQQPAQQQPLSPQQQQPAQQQQQQPYTPKAKLDVTKPMPRLQDRIKELQKQS
jgi:uncharacterized membrane protein (UPF0127 family)